MSIVIGFVCFILQALFIIATQPPPTLKNPDKWSSTFKDFLSLALCKNPDKRATTDDLLNHPFLQKASDTKVFGELIKKYKLVKWAHWKPGS